MADNFVMPEPNFLNKIFVDQNIKKLVEDATLWEKLLTKQAVTAMNVRYYREVYQDIETPNSSAMSASIDVAMKHPAFRAAGAAYAHMGVSMPSEYNLGLYQLAMEVDIPEEAVKYAELENMLVRSQRKLANAFASKENLILGDALTEEWSTSPTSIQQVDIASGAEWSVGAASSSVRPVKDILDAVEKIEDISGYSYKASGVLVSLQSYFDLRLWVAEKNFQYEYQEIGPETKVLMVEGLPVLSSNQVKRDYAVVADFKACGTLYESQPLRANQYWTDETHITHLQLDRTFNFALTDPKAVCTIYNTAA